MQVMIQEANGFGKRSIKSFAFLEKNRIQHKTRMIGNIEVYVDSPQRHIYRLEEYAEYAEAECRDSCQF